MCICIIYRVQALPPCGRDERVCVGDVRIVWLCLTRGRTTTDSAVSTPHVLPSMCQPEPAARGGHAAAGSCTGKRRWIHPTPVRKKKQTIQHTPETDSVVLFLFVCDLFLFLHTQQHTH